MVGMPASEARISYARMPGWVQRACLVVSRSWRPSPVGSGASSRRLRAASSMGEAGPDECKGSAGDWRKERVSRMAQLVWRASATRAGRQRERPGMALAGSRITKRTGRAAGDAGGQSEGNEGEARAGGAIEQGEVTLGDATGPEPGEGFVRHLIEEVDGGLGSRWFLRLLFGM